eukprot:162065-Hanusia_phi.AAC.3
MRGKERREEQRTGQDRSSRKISCILSRKVGPASPSLPSPLHRAVAPGPRDTSFTTAGDLSKRASKMLPYEPFAISSRPAPRQATFMRSLVHTPRGGSTRCLRLAPHLVTPLACWQLPDAAAHDQHEQAKQRADTRGWGCGVALGKCMSVGCMG